MQAVIYAGLRNGPRDQQIHDASRQRNLGDRMIGDDDKPSKWDLLATISMVGLVFFGTLRGWW